MRSYKVQGTRDKKGTRDKEQGTREVIWHLVSGILYLEFNEPTTISTC